MKRMHKSINLVVCSPREGRELNVFAARPFPQRSPPFPQASISNVLPVTAAQTAATQNKEATGKKKKTKESQSLSEFALVSSFCFDKQAEDERESSPSV